MADHFCLNGIFNSCCTSFNNCDNGIRQFRIKYMRSKSLNDLFFRRKVCVWVDKPSHLLFKPCRDEGICLNNSPAYNNQLSAEPFKEGTPASSMIKSLLAISSVLIRNSSMRNASNSPWASISAK